MSLFRQEFPRGEDIGLVGISLGISGENGVTAQAMLRMLNKETVARELLKTRFAALTSEKQLQALKAGVQYQVYPDPEWPTAGEAEACYRARQQVRQELQELGVVAAADDEFTAFVIAEALMNAFTDSVNNSRRPRRVMDGKPT